jgi:hypothetical protein
MRKLVLFELNEVPYRVVDDFVATRPGSALGRLLPRSRQFVTLAPDRGKLQPWITWPTLHRGIEEHRLAHLGQDTAGADGLYPPVWEILARVGVRTGVFGSLHSYPVPKDPRRYAFYVPDTFASGPECHPRALTPLQDLNLRMTRESGRNVSTRVPWRGALALALRAPLLGLRPATGAWFLRQLAAERRHPWKKVRRRSFQPVLLFDAFVHQLRREQPHFVTFFSNHVAAAMHRYWAATFPEDYPEGSLDRDWVARYREEIAFAMARFDDMLDRLIRFVEAHPEYVLWIASSMGQASVPANFVATKLFLRDLERFAGSLKLEAGDFRQVPAMEPTVNLIVAPERVEGLRARLEGVRISGRPLFFRERDGGFFNFVFGQNDVDDRAPLVELDGRACSPRDIGLHAVPVEDDVDGTAHHVPEGILISFDPREAGRGEVHEPRREVSTTELAPAILRGLGQAPPAYMPRARTLELSLSAS